MKTKEEEKRKKKPTTKIKQANLKESSLPFKKKKVVQVRRAPPKVCAQASQARRWHDLECPEWSKLKVKKSGWNDHSRDPRDPQGPLMLLNSGSFWGICR